jgi:hypothetical protein
MPDPAPAATAFHPSKSARLRSRLRDIAALLGSIRPAQPLLRALSSLVHRFHQQALTNISKDPYDQQSSLPDRGGYECGLTRWQGLRSPYC